MGVTKKVTEQVRLAPAGKLEVFLPAFLSCVLRTRKKLPTIHRRYNCHFEKNYFLRLPL